MITQGDSVRYLYRKIETLPDPARFPFYLNELEYRNNYRDVDLNDRLIETLGEYARVAVTEQSPKK